jgi:hypothetical protein
VAHLHPASTRRPPAPPIDLALFLGSRVADDGIFVAVCHAAGLPPAMFEAATSAADRWQSALDTAASAGIAEFHEHLLHVLPPELAALLERPPAAIAEITRLRREAARMPADPARQGEDLLGAWALCRLWGPGVPEPPELRRYLDECGPTVSSAVPRPFLPEVELGLAAQHLATGCIALPAMGEALLAWTLEHALALSPVRFALLAATLEVWGRVGRVWLPRPTRRPAPRSRCGRAPA